MKIVLNDTIVSASASIDDIYDVLDKLMYNNEVICLENENTGNYLQLLCSKYSGIAEIRIYNNDSFSHFRAYSKLSSGEDVIKLKTSDFIMDVKSKHVLSTMILKRLMLDFLNHEMLSQRTNWMEITEQFTGNCAQ